MSCFLLSVGSYKPKDKCLMSPFNFRLYEFVGLALFFSSINSCALLSKTLMYRQKLTCGKYKNNNGDFFCLHEK